MKVFLSLLALCALAALVLVGVGVAKLDFLFGVILPYLAVVVFIVGFIYRVLKWAKTPVPFNITTTCGQQKSHPWIKRNEIENPTTKLGVIARMATEVLFFRSLFRNTKAELVEDQRVVYSSDKLLWLAGLVFHWSFLVVVVRHLRFFVEPVPACVDLLEGLDSFFQVGLPLIYITDLALVVGVTYLFFRRVAIPQLRYISLPADYFPLLLILAIALSGICMRYFSRVDITSVKELSAGLLSFSPPVPAEMTGGIGVLFYMHLFFVCALMIYFPMSKLMHMGGVFLSPTRNLIGNTRERRHVNPWNYPVKVHSYEAYEDEFRDKMKDAGIPVDKE